MNYSNERLGIFILYNKEGKIEPYVLHLLKSLQEVLKKIIVVVNGEISSEGKAAIQALVDEIIIRDNFGFDGGAYKEVLTYYVHQDELSSYDHLVLFNDTFIGPFYDWKNLFEEMESKKFDFWGLSKWIGGFSTYLNANMPEHIQSYFISVSRNLFTKNCFLKFWDNMSIPDSYSTAILNFEIAFTQFFKHEGFTYGDWISESGGTHLYEQDIVIYNDIPDKLINDYRFPVLKRKTCTMSRVKQLYNVVRHVENVQFKQLLANYFDKELYQNTPWLCNELFDFYSRHKRIFIYGNGKYATQLITYLKMKNMQISGIVVTQKQEEQGILQFDQVAFESNDGIILAVSHRNASDIYQHIKKYNTVVDIYRLCREIC